MTQIKIPAVNTEALSVRRLLERRAQRRSYQIDIAHVDNVDRDDEDCYWIKPCLQNLGLDPFVAGVVAEIIKTVLTIFLFVFVVVVYIVYIPPLREKPFNKYPVLVWMEHELAPRVASVSCPRGERCQVYSRFTVPKDIKIDAYLFSGPLINFSDLPLPRNRHTVWALMYYDSPTRTPQLLFNKTLSLFNFSSTFSEKSDLPIPIWHIARHNLLDNSDSELFPTIQKDFKSLAPIMYYENECHTLTGRDEYVKELMNYIAVDSFGVCLHNKDVIVAGRNVMNDLDIPQLFVKQLMMRYKFMVVIEDSVCDGYISERLWQALSLGVVPIYFGCTTIRDWLPNEHCAILIEDFATPKLLSEYICKLLENDQEYDKYLEHKNHQIISNFKLYYFLEKYDMLYGIDYRVKRNFQCMVCEKLHLQNDIGVNVVNRSHFNCPMTSALTRDVSPLTSRILQSWVKEVNDIYSGVLNASLK